jgi:aminoglycoside phosphotransferase (APT) family kinase protein
VPDDTRLSDYVGVVATAWPGSFGRAAVRLHEGRDHDVVLLGEEAAFRFPRTERALDSLPREVAALSQLMNADPKVDVVLPEVLVDCSDNPLGRAFVAQRYLDGDVLPTSSVEAVGPMAYRFAAELARVLDCLAAVTITPDLERVLTRAPLRRTWDELAALCGPESREAFDAVRALDTPPPTLTHGDFVGANLRWDPDETRLTGVLDWAQVHLGDPAYDIASIADTYGWDLAETVSAAMAHDDAGVTLRARAYAATFPFQRAL